MQWGEVDRFVGKMTLEASWEIPEKIQIGAWFRRTYILFLKKKNPVEFLDLLLYRYFVQRK